MWNVTGSMLLTSMWKLYMQAYSEAIYGIAPLGNPVDNIKEKQC